MAQPVKAGRKKDDRKGMNPEMKPTRNTPRITPFRTPALHPSGLVSLFGQETAVILFGIHYGPRNKHRNNGQNDALEHLSFSSPYE